MTKHRSGFQMWHISLPIAVIATLFCVNFIIENWAMMTSEENPFAAIGILMIYSTYIGISMLVAIAAWIVTAIFIVRGARS